VLLQGEPRDAAVNFDMHRILQRHHAVSLPQHGFLVGPCLQTAVNYLSKSDRPYVRAEKNLGFLEKVLKFFRFFRFKCPN